MIDGARISKTNVTRLALLGFLGACGLAAWLSERIIDTHWPTRQFVIQSTLARVEHPVIILGDSITEAATPPRSVCGHPIVNAGVGGASTTSKVEAAITTPLAMTAPALIVVALGTNDAAKPVTVDQFRLDYAAMIARLRPLKSRLAFLGIPPPESGLPESSKVSDRLIDDYNDMLPDLARETGAGFIAMPPMPARHTLDGLHLNKDGYAVWDAALMGGIARLICPPEPAPARP